MDIINWSKQHKNKSILGQKVSYMDTEEDKKAILVIHGFGSSSFECRKIFDELKEDYRVIMPDLIGFGLSTKPTKYYFSLVDQASILLNLIESLEIKNLSIIAQGFGSSIMCELLSLIKTSSRQVNVNSIFFLNFSLCLETVPNYEKQQAMASMISSTFLKLSSTYALFKKYTLKSFSNQNAISEDELKTSWKLLNYKDGAKTYNFSHYWSVEIQKNSMRWLEVINNFKKPVYLVLGKDSEYNELIDFSKINKMLKIEKTYLLDDCGYFLLLEKPKAVAQFIKRNISIHINQTKVIDVQPKENQLLHKISNLVRIRAAAF